jgi:hypothetical protein
MPYSDPTPQLGNLFFGNPLDGKISIKIVSQTEQLIPPGITASVVG